MLLGAVGKELAVVGPQGQRLLQVGIMLGRLVELGEGFGTFGVAAPVVRGGGNETILIPKGGFPLPQHATLSGAMPIPVEQARARTVLGRPVVLGRGPVKLAGLLQRGAAASVQSPVAGLPGEEALEVPQFAARVAILLGVAGARLVPGRLV